MTSIKISESQADRIRHIIAQLRRPPRATYIADGRRSAPSGAYATQERKDAWADELEGILDGRGEVDALDLFASSPTPSTTQHVDRDPHATLTRIDAIPTARLPGIYSLGEGHHLYVPHRYQGGKVPRDARPWWHCYLAVVGSRWTDLELQVKETHASWLDSTMMMGYEVATPVTGELVGVIAPSPEAVESIPGLADATVRPIRTTPMPAVDVRRDLADLDHSYPLLILDQDPTSDHALRQSRRYARDRQAV